MQMRFQCGHCGRLAIVSPGFRGTIGREQAFLALARSGWLLNRHGGRHFCGESCAGAAARDVTPADSLLAGSGRSVMATGRP